MINSRSTPEEIAFEYHRLRILIASLENDLTAFEIGCLIQRPLSEIEDELHGAKITFKEVEKRFLRLSTST